MSVLVDTNVLLRRTQPDHPDHAVAVESVARLLDDGVQLFVTFQNMAEFWNVATRPIGNNGMGLSIRRTVAELDMIERVLTVLPDTPAVYPQWKRLVVSHNVLGVKVHDTRLVAAMHVHGLDRILTFNVADFVRFNIGCLHPAAVHSGAG
jgi:predicted nucleic acid-binding protein